MQKNLKIEFLLPAVFIGAICYTVLSFAFYIFLNYWMMHGQAGSPYRNGGWIDPYEAFRLFQELILFYYTPLGALFGLITTFVFRIRSLRAMFFISIFSWIVLIFVVCMAGIFLR
ncbi:hypothetical protein [Leptospira yasudae]|uniref:hypothetical protein n=1 Tax=Leptospira yasudae TaxID=2202201 RepID=UPI001091173B|nr:hypothetical protein [Leptospira yasudae]TGM96466.1 hypothetical protein EHR10_17085 [Leptospira yasudae]